MADSYRVLVGVNYLVKGAEVRGEPGEIVTDVPVKVAKQWLADGVLEEVEG